MPIERAQDVYGSQPFRLCLPSPSTDSTLPSVAASKALAEKAAWNFVKENNVDFSFSTCVFSFLSVVYATT
jgi:hypothetical protein